MSQVYSKIKMMMKLVSDMRNKSVNLDMKKDREIMVEVGEKGCQGIDVDTVVSIKRDLLRRARVRTSRIRDHMTSREAMIVGLLVALDHRQDHHAPIAPEVLALVVSRNQAEVEVQPVMRQVSINVQFKRPSFSPKSS